jgi:hypothetical protein
MIIIVSSFPLALCSYSFQPSQAYSIPDLHTVTNLTKAIGMSMTSGQSIFGFIGRVLGTALAMVFSLVIWYIVDQKTPGIIVMLWLFIFLEMYFFIKFQRFIAIFLVAIITQILIIGSELQVRKIGIAACMFQTKIVAVHLNRRLTLPSDRSRSTILSHLRARTTSTGMCCWRFFRGLYMDNLSISTYRPKLAP